MVKKNENKNPLKVILEMEKENELAIKVEGIENSDQIIPTTNNLFKQGLEPLKFHCSNLSLINPKVSFFQKYFLQISKYLRKS